MLRDASASLLIRIARTGLVLAVQIVLARLMGVRDYGVYVYAVTAMNLMVIVGKMGVDKAQLRFVSAYRGNRQWGRLSGLLGWTQGVAVLAAVGTAILVAVTVAAALVRTELQAPLAYSLWIGCAAVPFLALSGVRQAALRSLDYVVLAQLPEAVLRPLLLLALAGGFWLGMPRAMGAPDAMAITCAAAIVSFAVADLLLRRRIPAETRDARPEYARREWLDTSVFLLVTAVINLLLNRTDILLIGAVLGTTQVGPYAAASRTAVVIQFGLNAVALVAAPLIAGFHAQRRTRELQRVITLSGYGILAYTVVVTAGLIVAGRWLLSLFGQGFPDAYPILIVLAVGNIGNALTGPASLVMSMTGAQRRLTVIMSIFLGVNVVFTLLLLPAFGPLGAALVTAAAGIGWNVTATLVVRRRFGLNCFAIQRLEPEGADGAAR